MRVSASFSILAGVLLGLAPVAADAQLSFLGDPIELSQTEGVLDKARVAIAPDGTTLVAWTLCNSSGAGRGCVITIFGRIFDPEGDPLTDQFPVVESVDDGSLLQEVAASASGTFLVLWTRDSLHGQEFVARGLDADGLPLGPEVVLRTPARDQNLGLESELPLSVAALPDGGYLVTWDFNSNRLSRIEAQRLDADGALAGERFRVNAESLGGYHSPDVTVSEDGEALFVWIRAEFGRRGVRSFLEGRRFTADGAPLSGDLTLDDSTPTLAKTWPRVVASSGGELTVAWINGVLTPRYLVRRYGPGVEAIGGRVQVNTSEDIRSDLSLVPAPASRAVAIWTSVFFGARGTDLRARVLERKGRASGVDSSVTPEDTSQYHSRSALAPSGRLFTVWVDEGFDPLNRSIMGRWMELGRPVRAWPNRPAKPRAEAVSPTEIRLTWNDNSANETGFEIEIRPQGSSWRTAVTEGADVEETLLRKLEPGTSYSLRVRAVNLSGGSNWSRKTSATLPVD